VYDPATGEWEPTGPMVVPRLDSTAILLASGKVLVVGGLTTVPQPNPVIPATTRSELYDPEANAWTETKGSLRRPVIWNTLALLPTGEVLLTNGLPQVYNGIDPTCRFNAEADIYDPITEEWRPAHPMLNAHSYPSAVRLPSGRVLLAGGGLHPGCFTSLSMFPSEVYDPWHDAWAPTPPLRHFEFGAAAAVLLQSGQVLFTGGETTDFMPWTHWDTLSAAQIFDEGPLPEAVP
ncbi:MAG TPA: hypothetical protein VLD85_07620, partial [Anaeromyxobacteraceae bacterium]|nr:hypothetical protein [Anaeromyxobacteraceae bacterium]